MSLQRHPTEVRRSTRHLSPTRPTDPTGMDAMSRFCTRSINLIWILILIPPQTNIGALWTSHCGCYPSLHFGSCGEGTAPAACTILTTGVLVLLYMSPSRADTSSSSLSSSANNLQSATIFGPERHRRPRRANLSKNGPLRC